MRMPRVFLGTVAVLLGATIACLVVDVSASAAGTVKVGLNYPKTGPYSAMGLDQWRATEMAVEEINTSGGILGKKVKVAWRDSQSKPRLATQNVIDLIEDEGAKMIFGGSSSDVACAAGDVCQRRGVPFFATLTYSTATTGPRGHRHTFRECYDAWMGAKALGSYLNSNFSGKKYYYITADYTWGHTTEASLRTVTNTGDRSRHMGMLTPFPSANKLDFKKVLSVAKMVKPDVLVMVLFGDDMVQAVRLATAMGLKNKMQIVVPNVTLDMASGAGAQVMEGVVGALPWCWQVPYEFNYTGGKKFVEGFAARYGRYPSTSAASAYTILHEYKAAVERAGGFDSPAVVKALEGHSYQLLKDEQTWRAFDHQSVQTVYAVRCKPEAEVLADKFQLDYFEILQALPGDQAAISRADWEKARQAAGKATYLESFPGENRMATR